MKHIISAVVENRPGVLARVIGLISGRGYNIHSLNVAPTQDAATSRITMVVPGDDRILEQVTKQLNKLVDVIKVYDLTSEKYIDRELMLVKIMTTAKNRSSVIELAALFRAEIVCVQNQSLTIQMVGATDEVDNFLELVKPNGVQDVSRTGVIAVSRAEG
ncbi:MAG: acetolactate synthase small subunit [Verrucomicrobia bacterium]|nr:acetolactate synthase small subunit [Verrucomicrobiota bacterium]MCG2678598.1 acetolactate synthase small subunit [Kiritimatiellia bacterium]MBU4247916.1 acetolactate synthase small subunit [Verrucomicrobiota bacterium]MBU4291662.1 acetolactate synthase small subunit [Verrucomicrobiota bacterium]MBU4427842.1 acetolactate synthase small subunit [Verrucomicrobiota bacterium]